MIEPAAYGAAVLFGPHVWNFKEPAGRLIQQGAAVQVATPEDLCGQIARLLKDSSARRLMAVAARRFVQSQQGATDRTLALLDKLIGPVMARPRAA
jgi:3-deoxy-D-manno-octulosonic-acid transferase